uniref:DUF4291 domain-containing protein n=1 Tax=Thaumasiovibrio occultus TaxID=1891184 RepID=UPI000B354B65|nr:DUF4291 domain-containing protein [Thaumasiovibrio occultus]
MKLLTEKYTKQLEVWPREGKHILAQYDENKVVVYQAYRPGIGLYAAEHQRFGGPFSYTRMSWIKPNFLWMMYRSGWGTKENQEITLAIHLKRAYFDELLANAYPSTNAFNLPDEEWKETITKTNVRLQWDPDHDPYGERVERRAVQLGLRNEFLLPFSGDGIVEIEDISSFVAEQRKHVEANELHRLETPTERVYEVSPAVRKSLTME